MKKTLTIFALMLLTACFSRSAAMTGENFDNIQIGTSIASVQSQVGKPYKIHSKGGNKEEYEYIERIDMGQCLVSENHYFLIVVNGQVTGKYIKREKSPSYDLIYIEDPNHPCYH
ncbi:MAG: hypothetical protein KF898_10835 [Parachlamydiales bacterium]|nr:hypothetical protein [Verrucomicrobiota bacterium]MBX3720133.1 hypothetical protein [Candidatus Acheromyda pituitae]